MKITQDEVLERQAVLHIELEDGDLDKYLDRGYRRVVQRTQIPGFRKGKAPRRIVESLVGREALLNEIIDSMVPEVTGQAIEEQELEAAALPQIELLELDPLTLKAVVPLSPLVELGPYKDVRVAKELHEVTQEDTDNRLDQLRQGMASWEPVERPVEMGDMVTIQVVGKVGDSTVLDQKDAVVLVDGDSPRPVPGFSQHMVGLKPEESKEFDLEIPEDFQDQNIAGKVVHFSVTLADAKERMVPDLDDEFAKGVGDGFEDLAALTEKVKADLSEEAEVDATQRHREAVVQALMDGTSVELSPVMVEHEVGHMLEERQRTLARINIRMDDYLQSIGRTEEDMRAELREEAVARLSRIFVLTEVSTAEGVDVSDEEVDERIQALLAGSPEQDEGQTVSDDVKESVRRSLVAEKTIDKLVEYAAEEPPAEPRARSRTRATAARPVSGGTGSDDEGTTEPSEDAPQGDEEE